MRVPGIAWWPSRIPAGSIQREPASTMDLLPTCAKLAGTPLPDVPLDGRDLAPLLFGNGTRPAEVFLYYRGPDLYAARLGPWKAHFITRSSYGPDAPVPHNPPLLFHLGEDPGEQWNLANEKPDVLRQIRDAVDAELSRIVPGPTQLAETE
jgi:arylsulfatase A-like enzyme